MYQIADPYLQFQFMKAHHGLVWAKCQATYLKIETGCSHQTILAMKIKLGMKLKLQLEPQALGPQLKKRKVTKATDQKTNVV